MKKVSVTLKIHRGAPAQLCRANEISLCHPVNMIHLLWLTSPRQADLIP